MKAHEIADTMAARARRGTRLAEGLTPQVSDPTLKLTSDAATLELVRLALVEAFKRLGHAQTRIDALERRLDEERRP